MFCFLFPAFEVGSSSTDGRFPAVIISLGYPNQLTKKVPRNIYVTGMPAEAFVTLSLIYPAVGFQPDTGVKLTSLDGAVDMEFNSSFLSPGSIPGDKGTFLVQAIPNEQELHPIFLLKFTGESVF